MNPSAETTDSAALAYEMDKKMVRLIVRETIEELKRTGLLQTVNEMAYGEITNILYDYYKDGMCDHEISKALKVLDGDPYAKIIPLYFCYGYTIERIAETFDVDVSTVTRNKKRLCLSIYNAINGGA